MRNPPNSLFVARWAGPEERATVSRLMPLLEADFNASTPTSMLSWNSPSNLKIVGAEGHNADSLRQAVEGGAKFVIYSYNFSLVVMSSSDRQISIFIPAGQNRIMKGLPFTLISLVFGWWGIPWGIIYTLQSLHQNLLGGNDVTQQMLASLAPRRATSGIEAAAPLPRTPPHIPISPRRIASIAAVVTVLVAVIYTIICAYEGQNLHVRSFLVSAHRTRLS